MTVTTVALPERVHRRLTAAAAEEHTVMTELVRQAVDEWLKRRAGSRRKR
jgi:predicted transcriptional regulator